MLGTQLLTDLSFTDLGGACFPDPNSLPEVLRLLSTSTTPEILSSRPKSEEFKELERSEVVLITSSPFVVWVSGFSGGLSLLNHRNFKGAGSTDVEVDNRKFAAGDRVLLRTGECDTSGETGAGIGSDKDLGLAPVSGPFGGTSWETALGDASIGVALQKTASIVCLWMRPGLHPWRFCANSKLSTILCL